MKPIRLSLAAFLLVLCSPITAPAASFEETEARILDAFGKVKSFTADISMDMPSNEQLGNMKLTVTGNLALLVEDDLSKFIQHVVAKVELPDGVQEMKMTMVSDGEFLHILSEGMGETSVVKTRPAMYEDFPPPGAELLLQFIHRDFEKFEVLDEQQVDGKVCHVIEAIMDGNAPGNRIRLHFDKETGVPVRIEVFEEDSAEPGVLRYSNIVMDPELKADLFAFTAPEGVEVVDLTQEPAPEPESAPEEEAPAEEAPAAPEAPPAQ